MNYISEEGLFKILFYMACMFLGINKMFRILIASEFPRSRREKVTFLLFLFFSYSMFLSFH